MDLIELLEDLFEAIKEAVSAHDADGFLRLDLIVISIDLGVLELALEIVWTRFIKEEYRSVVALALCSCQNEMERLRSYDVFVQLNASWEAEVSDALSQRPISPVLWRIFIQYFRRESSLEQVNFHKG